MVLNFKEIINKARKKVTANINGLTVANTRVIGRITRYQVMEFTVSQIFYSIKAWLDG